MGFKRKFIKDAVQALKDVANDTPVDRDWETSISQNP